MLKKTAVQRRLWDQGLFLVLSLVGDFSVSAIHVDVVTDSGQMEARPQTRCSPALNNKNTMTENKAWEEAAVPLRQAEMNRPVHRQNKKENTGKCKTVHPLTHALKTASSSTFSRQKKRKMMHE